MRHWHPRHTLYTYRNLKKTGRINLSPPIVLALGFTVLSLVGMGLLLLPFSTHEGISPLAALFSAVSAVTITGLTTVDIGTTYTPIGQAILITLVQIGGLGFITLSV
ncbi:MAG: potassium transporter, partial [Pusillimonas sp.]|nr:potassium transporter [Pusillimonas sp.]